MFKKYSPVYGILAVLTILQVVAVGLVIRYESNRVDRDKIVLDRISVMFDDVFPGMKSDLHDVSRKTSEIHDGVKNISNTVDQMNNKVDEVGKDVSGVATKVTGMEREMTGFFQDKSGLIWGHALNPYVLLAVLFIIVASVPLCSWFFTGRRRSREPMHSEAKMEKAIQTARRTSVTDRNPSRDSIDPEISPELRRVMELVERSIEKAGSALNGGHKPAHGTSNNPDVLH